MVGRKQNDPKCQKDKIYGYRITACTEKGKRYRNLAGNEILDVVTTFGYLGVRLTNTLSWEQHVSRISQRLYPKLGLLNRISSFLPPTMLYSVSTNKLYYPSWTMVRPFGMSAE